jgi:hypothetical protein
MADPKDREDKHDAAPPVPNPPRQALSGGGSDTHAGSDEGGSADGDDREDEAEPAVEGGLKDAATAKPAEDKTFAAPDGDQGEATQTVVNTGEPRPMNHRQSIENTPGDDVDAASG